MKNLSNRQWEAIIALDYEPDIKEVLFGGAAGGGKTALGCWWQINRRLMLPDTRSLIGRNVRKDLYDTTLMTFYEVWRSVYENNPWGVTFTVNEIKGWISFSNGSLIYLKDLIYKPSDKDFQSMGSYELTDAFLDETGEMNIKSRDAVSGRIRRKLFNNKPALLMCSNPSRNFLKNEFVSDDQGRPIEIAPHRKFIKSMLDDNPNKDFVNTYKDTLSTQSEYNKQRLLFGNWEMTENNNPFFDAYKNNRDKFLGETFINDFYPLYLSFDFNHSPCTVIVGQKIEHEKKIRIHLAEQINGGTEALVKYLVANYQEIFLHPAGLIVTGDTSGMNKTSVGGAKNDYDIIMDSFRLTKRDLVNVQGRNKNFTYSRALCNYVFQHIDILMDHDNSRLLIKDLDIAIAKEDGKLFKDREKGHGQDAGDAFRYLINAMFVGGVGEIKRWLN